MRRNISLAIMLGTVIALSGCGGDRMSEKGFVLPDGDAQAGRQAFIDLRCNHCHTVRGEEIPAGPYEDPPYVRLGGTSTTVKTYGQLATAITSPSRDLISKYLAEKVSEDGESKMSDYNQEMTVQQMADLVRFLQPHYKVIEPKRRMRPHF